MVEYQSNYDILNNQFPKFKFFEQKQQLQKSLKMQKLTTIQKARILIQNEKVLQNILKDHNLHRIFEPLVLFIKKRNSHPLLRVFLGS